MGTFRHRILLPRVTGLPCQSLWILGLFKLDCWRALQLTHFLRSLPSPDKFGQNLTRYETYCSGEGVLITPPEDYQLPCLSAWEIDFRHKFTARQRQNTLIFTYGSSMCTKIQETNFKIVTRWYNTPAKLQKIYPSSSDRCWRCQEDRGTILRVFWACPKLQQFWKTIQQVAQNVTGCLIPNDPAFFLLHASNIPSKSYKKSILCHLFDAAKTCIPLCWKSTQAPSIGLWFKKVEEIKKMEDLILTKRHQRERYAKTWSAWDVFVFSDEGRFLFEGDMVNFIRSHGGSWWRHIDLS